MCVRDGAGADGVAPDPFRAVLPRERLRDADHAKFGRTVSRRFGFQKVL